MTNIKSTSEIAAMQEGGKRLGEIRNTLLDLVKPGATPLEIDICAQKLIAQAGGVPSFQTVRNYQWATCISVNDAVVHGIPDSTPFREGDVVNVDVGILYKGLHTDTGWTIALAKNRPAPHIKKFLKAGKKALAAAIEVATIGNTIGHISQIIQQTIESEGYQLVPSLVGHGIGKSLHEKPQVPNVLRGGVLDKPKLFEGMTMAIEPIYVRGKSETCRKKDGWTVVTVDGSVAGQFEHTIAITKKRPIVLTQ